MNTAFYSRTMALAVGALALLGGSFSALPVQAQAPVGAADADKPVTLNLVNTSLPTALRLLFKNAGVTAYTIAPDVQGLTTLDVQDVPLSAALRAVLRSASPAAAFTAENGTYTVTRKPAEAALLGTPARTASAQTVVASRTAGAAGTAAKVYGSIPINKYDAYVIAALLGTQGIASVPPNDVVSSAQIAALQNSVNRQNGAQNGQQNGQQNGGGGGGRGRRNRGGGGGGGGYYGG